MKQLCLNWNQSITSVKKAEFTRNADGKITGFTINFGDNWNWAMYIEYTTELTSELPKGTQVANVLEWSASNFQKSRSVSALTRLENRFR